MRAPNCTKPLDGRRINVERSAGGGRSSETRKTKLKNYQEEQDQYISSVVDKILDHRIHWRDSRSER
jgi:hypothetical protein